MYEKRQFENVAVLDVFHGMFYARAELPLATAGFEEYEELRIVFKPFFEENTVFSYRHKLYSFRPSVTLTI